MVFPYFYIPKNLLVPMDQISLQLLGFASKDKAGSAITTIRIPPLFQEEVFQTLLSMEVYRGR
jgi:hypothetical protein